MCTVTFIPVRDNFIITSNRDEKKNRKKAIEPSLYQHNGWNMVYPKDAAADGTWIAAKENGDAAVLLNGAFICHVPQAPYRMSRGQLFLEIISNEYPARCFWKIDLSCIEPFTLVVFEKQTLYEFRWDGDEKYAKQLSKNRPHIWSSATLYDGLIAKEREQWFANFLNKVVNPTQLDVLSFHKSTEGDRRNSILMERDGIYATVSITSVLLNRDRAVMKYIDIESQKESETKIGLIKPFELV